jgi:glycosyltransferase involved in cell wall biosynthesis
VLRHIDRQRFKIDFVVHTTEPGAYDDEAKSLGAKILPCLTPSKPWEYRRNFNQILREHGPYHVVHSHVHHFSGYILWLAAQAGVPVRIAHSHLDTLKGDLQASMPRRVYLKGMLALLHRYATHGLSASEVAAPSLFGENWRNDPRWRVFFCAIDLNPFKTPLADGEALRASLGVPPGVFLAGHAGRFAEQKNHRFLIDVAAETVRRDPNVYFVLVGEGSLRPEIEARAEQAGIKDHVIFTGVRSDVPRIMQTLDVFVMPSLFEGLPLVGIEAQASGTRSILADTITPEVVTLPEQVQFLPIQSAAQWAEAILKCKQTGAPLTREQALDRVLKSPFNIDISTGELEQIYSDHANLR